MVCAARRIFCMTYHDLRRATYFLLLLFNLLLFLILFLLLLFLLLGAATR